MKRMLSPLIAGLGTVAGVLIVVLYVGVEFEQIQQWKMWDPLRRGPDADVHVLIARMRNDPAGGHTEDVVEAVKKTAMVHYRLPREWPDPKDAEDAKQRREDLFSETGALVLHRGIRRGRGSVAPRLAQRSGPSLGGILIWAKCQAAKRFRCHCRTRSRRRSHQRGGKRKSHFDGGRDAYAGAQSGFLRGRTKTRTGQEGQARCRLRDCVGIAGIRADGPQGEHDAETAVRIYRQLLEHAKQPVHRLPVLTNPD